MKNLETNDGMDTQNCYLYAVVSIVFPLTASKRDWIVFLYRTRAAQWATSKIEI